MTSLESTRICVVELPSGEVSLPVSRIDPPAPRATVILAPGAGAGAAHPFMAAMAAAIADCGMSVVRFDFPYRVLGRRMPGPASHSIRAWAAVFEHVRREGDSVPIIAMGKSYGGRMASMATAEDLIDPDALVYLGYPLHPPGRPEKERAAHLPLVTVPQLFVSGSRDPFILPAERWDAIVRTCPAASIAWMEGADHSFERARDRRTAGDVAASVLAEARDFLEDVACGQRDTPGGAAGFARPPDPA
ncbi:alpha/beta family hydrolase [Microbacterium sp. NPDC077184]|uniref:alpha/beta hydrolase family protein n=1 Tax=Microbacterium sp. NPDC077184 TaxID=3154764 RepID=UPI0034144AA9